MGIAELFLLAVGLSMDAFAVAICKGLAMQKMNWKKAVIIGLWFGGFQALMPVIGYLLGAQFAALVDAVDHWLAFILLSLIGGNMIRESRDKEACGNEDTSVKTMFLLAVATSIDALVVGVTFAFLSVNIVLAAILIGCTTFVFSVAGTKIGHVFGSRYKSKAEFAGGLILVALGVKILVQALFF